MQGPLHRSACPRPWAPPGPWLLAQLLVMRPHRSCTSCLPTSSLTHSCYTTTCRRTLRVAPVSAASPAPCSPSRKPPNLPTATLHTGQTEPRRGVGWGGAYSGQERTHGAHFSRSPAPFPRVPETCNCVSRASVGSLPPRLAVVCSVFMYVFVNVIEVLGEWGCRCYS